MYLTRQFPNLTFLPTRTMSLFAAYASKNLPNSKESTAEGRPPTPPEDWLRNSSFIPCEKAILSGSSDESSDEEQDVPVVPQVPLVRPVATESASFFEDRTRTKEYFSVDKIYYPAAPRFRIKQSFVPHERKRRFKRYFRCKLGEAQEGSKDSSLMSQESELSRKTARFNRHLAEEMGDVKGWLEYVRFQDEVYGFEKNYKKGSMAKAQRVLADRKLCIIEKALAYNPGNEELMRERLSISVANFPADELQSQLKILVEKDSGNLILWQGYIEATQCSMSHCTASNVLALYTKCLSTLHQLRRTASLDKDLLEENILKMLYQCGLFLKQAGLNEQLWTLLKMYLELNLAPFDKNKFTFSGLIQESQLVELEEMVFQSHLPLHELWLRTEKLREACHWLPVLLDDPIRPPTNCEDPQRIVLVEDVNELIHPITRPDNIFKLTATILTLLKVPLLPCRHTIMQNLGLDYVPWSLDSIESVLPVFFSNHPVDLTQDNFLSDLKLAIGPQYLKSLPGQNEYLEFVLGVMRSCGECLVGRDQSAAFVWWLRFQRYLFLLNKLNRIKLPQGQVKTMRSRVKSLLRNDLHRNNALFYCEYALLEGEANGASAGVAILKTTLSSHGNAQAIQPKQMSEAQTITCHLVRSLIELQLKENNQSSVIVTLVNYVLQSDLKEVTREQVGEADRRFKLLSLQLVEFIVNSAASRPTVEQFLPNFPTDFLIINGWFLYLTKSPIDAAAFVEKTLTKLPEADALLVEVLYEFYVTILLNSKSFVVLREVLERALEKFPNNLFLLGVAAKEQSLIVGGLGRGFWRLKEVLLRGNRAQASLFAVLIACGKEREDEGWKKQVLALFKRVTREGSSGRRCGLIWRLYLQFTHAHYSPEVCRNVYYAAVEECPWMKALYVDAAIYIPAELPQIQDLIIEKQLRLHVTPEELEVLRKYESVQAQRQLFVALRLEGLQSVDQLQHHKADVFPGVHCRPCLCFKLLHEGLDCVHLQPWQNCYCCCLGTSRSSPPSWSWAPPTIGKQDLGIKSLNSVTGFKTPPRRASR